MPEINFDANKYEPAQDYDPIPPGKYPAVIVASEMKETKARTGQYLELTIEIVGEKYKGRLVWDRLNLINQNQTAVEIANRTLSSICHATGKMRVRDSEELHNIPMLVTLDIEKRGGYDPTNRVKRYEAVSNAKNESTISRAVEGSADSGNFGDDVPW